MKLLLAVAISSLLVVSAFAVGNCDGAGNCYVSNIATGSGTGADWNNACTDLTGACDVTNVGIRGTTIWVAGAPGNPIGNPYTAKNFSAPDSGSTLVTINMASAANHGTQTGWRKEFATAMAILQGPVNISTDNWVINGQVRAANWRAYHDFAENIPLVSNMCFLAGFPVTGYHLIIVNGTANSNAVNVSGNNVTLKYMQIMGTRTLSGSTDSGLSYSAGVTNEYLGFSNICQSGGNSVNILSGTNFTFEYNHIEANNQGTAASTSSAINFGDVTGLIVRYNHFRDITGAAIMTDGNTDSTAFTPNWYFYGNDVYWIPSTVRTGTGYGLAAGLVNLTGETLNGGVVQVYNNTIAEINVSACTSGLTCKSTALTLNGTGTCPAHTQNCIGGSAPVGTVFNNLWWDAFAAQNTVANGSAAWTPTGDYGEGACLTTGCSNGGVFTVVGANDATASIANPFTSFGRPAITNCNELPNIIKGVGDQFNGCYFDFTLTADTPAGTTPSGWTTTPSGCSGTGGGNCENIDQIGVVRGTLGTGSQVSRGSHQFQIRRLTGFAADFTSTNKAVAVQNTGVGLHIGGTFQEVAVCTWNAAPLTDACPDSTPPFVKSWDSLDKSVATISSTGLVTAVSNHNAFMTLNYGGVPTDSNIAVVVTDGLGTQPIATLPTGIVRTGSPTAFASYDTTTFDANFPTTYSDPCPVTVQGGCTRWAAHTSSDFTNALNSSAPGDTIVLDAGATYSTNGSFIMPARANPLHKWTYIISSSEANLPPQGTRVNTTTDPGNMPKLVQTGGASTLSVAPGADHWWISGMEASCAATSGTPRPVCGPRISTQADTSAANMPDSITVDRCYFHGDNSHDTNHGLIINASHFAVLDSYLNFFGEFQSQADVLSSYLTPGPLKVINNLIGNGWGEDSIMGGAGGYSNPWVVSDGYFSHNTVLDDPAYRAVGLTIPPKAQYNMANNFELKSCQRCLIDGNIMENSWVATQGGGQFVMNAGTGVNGPDVVVNEITFSNNIMLGAVNTALANGGQFAAQYNGCDPNSQPCYYPGENRRITGFNNLWVQGNQGPPGGRAALGSATIAATLDRLTTDLLYQHNTFVGPYLTDHVYCERSFFFNPQSGDMPSSSNVWLLDNVLCRQPSSDLPGPLGTPMLNQVMPDPPSVPIACPTGSTTCRFYGNVMEVFTGPPTNDTVATWPNGNLATTQSFTYNSPTTGDYTLTNPVVTGSDGQQSGIKYSVLVAHQAPPLGSCSISGTISGAISSGVELTITGGSTVSVFSNADGTYTFPNLAAGSYTVTPFQPGYTFAPSNLAITLTLPNCASTGNNFSATATQTFSISGTVSGAVAQGVTMTLTGSNTGSTTTDASGNYSFANLGQGSYTVTPKLVGYSFTPVNQQVTISNANVTGVNFTSMAVQTFSISGTVTLNGTGQSGVTMTLTGAGSGTTTTDSNGNYTFSGLNAGTYTITPSKSGFTYNPTNLTVTITTGNVTGQNFTATPVVQTFSISGQVTASGVGQSGVTIALTGQSTGSTTTDSNGNYSFANLSTGTYTLTPKLVGFTFTPTSITVQITNANITGQNFTSSPSITPTWWFPNFCNVLGANCATPVP